MDYSVNIEQNSSSLASRLWSCHSLQGHAKLRLGSDNTSFTPKTTFDTERQPLCEISYSVSCLPELPCKLCPTLLKYRGTRKEERAW